MAYSAHDQMADDIREQARQMLMTLDRNREIASLRGATLRGCACATHERHAPPCLGPHCNCH